MPIFGLGWAIPVKSPLCKFGSDWLSLSRVIMSTNIFLWGRNPLFGGLYLTCDVHFWTRMSYSSQMSCVEILFGLIEIGGMLILSCGGGGGGGYKWPVMPIFELGRGCLDKSHVREFGSDWLRLSRVIARKNQMTGTQTRTKIFKIRSRSSPIGELKNMLNLWVMVYLHQDFHENKFYKFQNYLINPFSSRTFFGQVQKFFLENL